MKKGPSRTFLPGLRLGHVVEDQRVEVGVRGQDQAYKLLERIGDMNRSRFLPAIERVFDEFDRPGEIVRIDRLDLDLGTLPEAELGRAEERLTAALREALRKAMPPAASEPGQAPSLFASPAAMRAVGDALVDAFLHYLLHGAWPYGSALDVATAPADLLARLIETEPAALALMLRRHGRSEAVVRRLVGQMPPELLERLLPVLEPADAAWMLVHMAETKASHREEPLVDESPEAFEQLLWTIVLRDAINRAGLRANRRAFLRNLIERIAESGSASYRALLAQIGRGLVAVPGMQKGADSFLSIIRELDSEERRAAPPRTLSFIALVEWLEGGVSPESSLRGSGETLPSPDISAERTAAAPPTGADRKALAQALHSHPAEARWLLTRLIGEDGETLLTRLQGLLTAEEVARLLLPAARAGELAFRLKAAGGPRAKARLLQAALRDFGKSNGSPSAGSGGPVQGHGADSRVEPGSKTSFVAPEDRARSGRAGAGAEGGPALSPLERIEQALGAGPVSDSDPGEWKAALSRAIAAAASADPVALRRLMRRFAVADPVLFLDRAGAAIGTDAVLVQLLPAPSGATLASLVEIAACTQEETARLVRLAATMPASASPAASVRRALSQLAGGKGMDAEALRRQLLARARESGGVSGRDLVRLLEESAEPRIRPDDPEARRAATLDSLRALLIAPGTRQSGATVRAARLSSLSGLSAAALRERLGGPSLDRRTAASALALLDESALTRLVLLLAPAHGGARADLRHRLKRSPRGAGLAEIAAELLITGAVERDSEIAVPSVKPVRSRGAAALRLVERALRAGGDALAAPEVREALARLLGERPLELVRLLASPGTSSDTARTIVEGSALGPGFGAAGPLLRDPMALALAFGALPASERDLAAALAALIAGPGGRSAIPPENAAFALASAAASMLGRPAGHSLAARWLGEMLRSASLSEGRALRRLIASRWPDKVRDAQALIALGLGPPDDEAGRPMPVAKPKQEPSGAADDEAARPMPTPKPKQEPSGKADDEAALPMPMPEPKHEPSGAADDEAARPTPTPKPKQGPSGKADDETALPMPKPWSRREPGDAADGAARDGGGATPIDKGSIAWLVRMLRDRPPGYDRLLRRLLRGARAREAACRLLPETLLVRLLATVDPHEARSVLSAAELVAKALEASGGSASRAAIWNALLTVGAGGGGIETLLDLLLGGGARRGLRIPSGSDLQAVWTRLAALAQARGHQPLRTALDELAHDRRKAAARRPAALVPDPHKPSEDKAKVERKLWEGADDEAGLRIAIANAGLVLVAPFLPAFFRRLDLLDPDDPEGKTWRSQQARDRGIHLLQYLVEGRCDRPEPVLALNKLLCGQTLGFPVSASIAPTESELEICTSLLEAILTNWPMLKDSSVEALRETFLQREGCIVRIEAGWRIDVERKVLDVLVDSLPWGFSMIFHPWMEEPVSVEW